MIPISAEHRAQILLGPVGEDQMKIEVGLFPLPGIEDFIDDEKAHAVCELEKLGRGRIVRAADGVAAQLEKRLKLTLGRAGVEGGAESAQVVMEVHTFENDVLAVDEHTLFRI